MVPGHCSRFQLPNLSLIIPGAIMGFCFHPKNRVVTPILLQMEISECGAAALGIILGFYGRYIPLEELRVACGVSRDGSKAINILKAARAYGFTAQGAKIEIEQLKDLSFPVIAFWEFNHFVVIEGYDDQKIYLNDPATGQRTVTYEEFNRAFTGIILVFEPTSEFQKGGHRTTLKSILMPRLKGLKKSLLFVVFASLSLVIPGVMIPGFTKIFIDDVLIGRMSGWLIPLLWGILITTILRAILSWIQQFYLLRLQTKINIASSARFIWHVLRLPFIFFSQRMIGDIYSRIAANNRVAAWLSGDLSTSIVGLLSMFFFLIILFLYDWVLTLIAITSVVFSIYLFWYVARYIENNSRRLQQDLGKLEGIEMSGLVAMETLKATGAQDDFFERWSGYHAKTLNGQQKIHLYSLVLTILPQFLRGFVLLIILGVGSWRIIEGHITVGSLVAFQSLLISFNEPLTTLLNFATQLQEIRADLTRLEDVQKHPEDSRFLIANKLSSEPLKKLNGKLQLRDISFGYSPLEPAFLENISLTLDPGKHIAIVGNSASGKSTLAKLICGLYTPWSGEILWDDQNMSSISPETLSYSLAFVDQDIFLFEGSVYDNLTLWNSRISEDTVFQAVQDMLLEPLLKNRPHGLHTHVMPAGSNFSGGQRQQLEIARALVQKPSILILDEATSALDAVTEQKIIQSLKNKGHSLLMIAHRLSTIRDCDEIIVLENGKIAERGTHEELYEKRSAYFHLLKDEEG